MILNCGAKRHHYSMFNVGRSMFDVHFFSFFRAKNNLALMGFIPIEVLKKCSSFNPTLSQGLIHPQGFDDGRNGSYHINKRPDRSENGDDNGADVIGDADQKTGHDAV
jgi:hypothetical protein